MSFAPPVALVQLAPLQEWLAAPDGKFPSAGSDLLERMIGAISSYIIAYLARPVAPATFTEFYDGTGGWRLPLRQRPVIDVQSLTIENTVIPPRPAVGQFGYVVANAESVAIEGPGTSWCGTGWWPRGDVGRGPFWRGIQNVQVVYDAGYQTSQAIVVPAAVAPATSAVFDSANLVGTWNTDRGVAYTGGAALTLVTTTPTVTGTYQVTNSPPFTSQTYVFAPGDVGANVTITYGFTPEAIVEAIVEIAGERLRSRNRIGQSSQNLGHGQVVAFSQKDMNEAAKSLLKAFRQVVPI